MTNENLFSAFLGNEFENQKLHFLFDPCLNYLHLKQFFTTVFKSLNIFHKTRVPVSLRPRLDRTS